MDVLRSFFSIKTILLIRIVFGFYNKITTNKAMTIILRAYCVIIATLIIAYEYIIVTQALDITGTIRFLSQGILYISHVFFNLYLNGERFPDFLVKIRQIGALHGLYIKDLIPVSRFLLLIPFLGRLLSHITYTLIYNRSYLLMHLSSFIMFLDMIQNVCSITRIMMFESMWHMMAELRKCFEEDLSAARRFENGQEVMRKKLRMCMNTYKILLKTTRVTDAAMKPLILITGITFMTKIINIFYTYIGYGGLFRNNVSFIECLIDFIVPLSPAVLAELANSEIDKMKACVVKQFLACKDIRTRDAIEDALMIFRQHQFKYTIWRLFTVDVTMVLSAIGLLVTYTVAMVQFSHFFD